MADRAGAKRTLQGIVSKFPGKEVDLIDAAADALDLSDGGESVHLQFVCEDIAKGLREDGIDITDEDFKTMCNALYELSIVCEY